MGQYKEASLHIICDNNSLFWTQDPPEPLLFNNYKGVCMYLCVDIRNFG